jgi:hypothetical protein
MLFHDGSRNSGYAAFHHGTLGWGAARPVRSLASTGCVWLCTTLEFHEMNVCCACVALKECRVKPLPSNVLH